MALLWTRGGAAWACPVCYSQTGLLVRAGILHQAFARNVVVTMIPFLVFAAAVTWIYYRFPLPSVEGGHGS